MKLVAVLPRTYSVCLWKLINGHAYCQILFTTYLPLQLSPSIWPSPPPYLMSLSSLSPSPLLLSNLYCHSQNYHCCLFHHQYCTNFEVMSTDHTTISWTSILKFEECMYKTNIILVQPLLEGYIWLVQRRILKKSNV